MREDERTKKKKESEPSSVYGNKRVWKLESEWKRPDKNQNKVRNEKVMFHISPFAVVYLVINISIFSRFCLFFCSFVRRMNS